MAQIVDQHCDRRALLIKSQIPNSTDAGGEPGAGRGRQFSRPSMTIDSLDQHLVNMKYAVRGAVVAKSVEIQKKLDAGEKLGFDKIIPCNIGNRL